MAKASPAASRRCTPAVYGRRTRWRKYDDELEQGTPLGRENDSSVRGKRQAAQQLFEAEALESTMR